MISSLHNPRVKRAIHLRDRRQREQQGRFVIDGARELLRVLVAGVAVEELFVCESHCTSYESQQVLSRLPQLNAEVIPVTPAVFEKLAYGERAEGVLAVAVTPRRTLADIALPPHVGQASSLADPVGQASSLSDQAGSLIYSPAPLVAVLEGIEKPGNLGAVLRSADATGISAVIVADGVTDLYNPNVIRASLGTIFTLPVCEASSIETITWLRERSLRIFAARADAGQLYTQADYRGGAAIVLGSEAAGLSSIWSAAGCVAVKLPMLGVADSLNVSATAAVLFYEALRQRSDSVV